MDDRLIQGFVAGIIGGLVQSVLKLALYVLHLATLLWLDFSCVLTQGELPQNLAQKVAHGVVMLAWTGVLGVVYAFLINLTGGKHSWFKGLWFGFLSWFAIYVIVHLFQVPLLVHIPAKTVFSDTVAGMLWGLTTAEALRWLEARTATATRRPV